MNSRKRGFEEDLFALRARMDKLSQANSAGPKEYAPIYKELEKISKVLRDGCLKAKNMYKY